MARFVTIVSVSPYYVKVAIDRNIYCYQAEERAIERFLWLLEKNQGRALVFIRKVSHSWYKEDRRCLAQ